VNRALDVAGASLGLVLASPFLAASALAIKL
jgi:lipopolysaccharide/colanic/teichoic acid biosynthesis glycosyltransferase